ncbi:hypothetical protein PTSG_10826 [Salpingoeca rosetta]|uniref:PH domain-containing protein n=1 Tax=Salpingoeca rosetta (strain ATCC 50818 / BSB-021) TaxID=946362 RepID=F2URH0_SALR5|nr:uncharacterized protein PTSG_10826 [Salpingoeca rosetta]EGD80139.1 hypothetical protein PTSG_10826 [Salpingoeca rosetta]|eukprot:XP_004988201.1 hypothetical protein PTSG_10826 [Salpingoeca rosetta]
MSRFKSPRKSSSSTAAPLSATSNGAGSSAAPVSAYMWKQGGMLKLWKRRWLVVNRDIIAYHEDEDSYPPKGVIQLSSLLQVVAGRRKCLNKSRKWPNTAPNWPQLSKSNYPMAIVVPHRTFFMFFSTAQDGQRVLGAIREQWTALAQQTGGVNPVTIDADKPEERSSRRNTTTAEAESVSQLLDLCSGGEIDAVEMVEDAVAASFAACFRSDLLLNLTATLCMREAAVRDFVAKYQKWERTHGYPPTCRVLFHPCHDLDHLLEAGPQTSAFSGLPSPLGDAYYCFPDGKIVSHYTPPDASGTRRVVAVLVMLGQTGVRESLYLDDQVTRQDPIMMPNIDLAHPQNTSPPVGCHSAAGPKLKQVAVYESQQILPVCSISYRLRLPLPNPFVEDAKDGEYLRSLAQVPRIWPEIEQSILIDDQARLAQGSLPLTRKAFRIYKIQMHSIQRRATMSKASVSDMHAQFGELQKHLASCVEKLMQDASASGKARSIASDKLETVNVALRACIDSLTQQHMNGGDTDPGLETVDEESAA